LAEVASSGANQMRPPVQRCREVLRATALERANGVHGLDLDDDATVEAGFERLSPELRRVEEDRIDDGGGLRDALERQPMPLNRCLGRAGVLPVQLLSWRSPFPPSAHRFNTRRRPRTRNPVRTEYLRHSLHEKSMRPWLSARTPRTAPMDVRCHHAASRKVDVGDLLAVSAPSGLPPAPGRASIGSIAILAR